MIIRFMEYEGAPAPYMTPEMTGGMMQVALVKAAAGLTGQMQTVVSEYEHEAPKLDQNGNPYWFHQVQKKGDIWNPGGGPRTSEWIGVTGTGIYFLEFGGTWQTALHIMRGAFL